MKTNYKEIINIIKKSRYQALKSVNTELINLYWEIGAYVSSETDTEDWGKATVKELSNYIHNNEIGIKGFSASNIWRMKQFYDTYKAYPKLAPLVREISWTNNLMIMSGTKSIEEKEFYLKLSFREKYSKRELNRQISSGYYERTILAPVARESQNRATILREIHPAAESVFKDSYVFDFLDLPDGFSENDLQKGLVNNLKKFLLEIGRDFSFIGENYRVQVGKNDFFIDLLFFHREL